jgi:UDP-N-acetylglucosamine 2-epimerase (non-hydrolysing)
MERPEALEAGSIVMAGIKAEYVVQAIDIVLQNNPSGNIPSEYSINDTSSRVLNFVLSTVHRYKYWNSLYSE